MSALVRFLYPLPAHRSVGSIIGWWERRRLAYNVVVGAAGLGTIGIIATLGLLPPGARLNFPPIGLIGVYAIMANLCYTAGWVVETGAEVVFRGEVKPSGPVLFRQGLIFSVGLTLLPVVFGLVDWAIRIVRALT